MNVLLLIVVDDDVSCDVIAPAAAVTAFAAVTS